MERLRNYLLAITSLLIIGACSNEPASEESSDQTEEVKQDFVPYIEITNTLPFGRYKEQIVIDRDDLPFDSKRIDFRVGETKLPFQIDDVDQDGEWDEVVLTVSVPADSTITLEILAANYSAVFESKTNVYLGVSRDRNGQFTGVNTEARPDDHEPQSKPWLYQFEGIGWENDMVAFRHYFDSRNGKDIFGKTTEKMILDTIGLPRGAPEGDYHNKLWWGMDVLKVGPSLGAGGIALTSENGTSTLGNATESRFNKILTGPIRSIFEIQHYGCEFEGESYDITERISIWEGDFGYYNQVKITPELPEGTDIVAGLVTMKSEHFEMIIDSTTKFAYTFGKEQSENKDALSMILAAPDRTDDKMIMWKKDSKTDIRSTLALTLGKSNSYKLSAYWEGFHTSFADKEVMDQIFKREREKAANPLLLNFL